MKALKYYTWEELQRENPKQTVVIVTYKGEKVAPWTRVVLGKWYSREDAWGWCQREGLRRYQEERGLMIDTIRLLRLSKVIKEFAETKPKRTSALAV